MLLGGRARRDVWDGSVIDADVHVQVPSLRTLYPYLDPVWQQFSEERGFQGPSGVAAVYPATLPTTVRAEFRPGDGRPPASDLTLLQEQLLDPWDVELAVVNCYYGVDYLRHPDWAAALARAVNDWLVGEFLDRDPRLRASIVVVGRDVDAIIEEIRRVGDHPGFTQVLFPVRSEKAYGNRRWHAAYAEMEKRDLVFGLHWGGTTEGAPSPSGWPSWYAEEYAAEVGTFATQITSLIAGGVFQRFPRLRVAVGEIGFNWLPAWLWRMDKDWKGLRREVPWVDELPSALVRRHFRFTTSPLDAGTVAELADTLEWLGGEELLLHATDYPHRHDDDLAMLLDALPHDDARERLMAGNARAWYRA